MNVDHLVEKAQLQLLVDQLVHNDGAPSVVQDWSREKTRRVVAAMVESGLSVPAGDVSAVLKSPGIVDTIQTALLRRELAQHAARASRLAGIV